MAHNQAITQSAPRHLVSGRFGPLRGDLRDPRFQAYLLLWAGFTAAPLLFGVDKFFNWMTYWPKYLWAGFPNLSGRVSSLHCMYAVGALALARLGAVCAPKPLRRHRVPAGGAGVTVGAGRVGSPAPHDDRSHAA